MELILACDMTTSTTGVTRWRKSSWIDGNSAFWVADDTLCFIPPGQRLANWLCRKSSSRVRDESNINVVHSALGYRSPARYAATCTHRSQLA